MYHGDCNLLLKELEPESIDSIVVDPVYGIAYQSKRAKKGSDREKMNTPLVGDEFALTDWLEPAARALKDTGVLYLHTRWDVFPEWMSAVNEFLAVKNCIVSVKTQHTAGDLAGNYAYKHEFILFAVKGRHLPYWDKREMNVWTDRTMTSAEKRYHPTQKSLEVIKRCIRNSVPPGGVVLDPQCGSGTTLVAASQLGVRSIGMEIDMQYIDATLERLTVEV